jgi:hypothetical protein
MKTNRRTGTMLDHEMRVAILKLHREGHGLRVIAKAPELSRGAVWRVLGARCDGAAAMTEPCAQQGDDEDEQERRHDAGSRHEDCDPQTPR